MITGGIGVLALGGSGIAFGIRQDALSELQRKCPLYATLPCDRSVQPTVSRGQTAASMSTGLFVGGAIAVGIGLTMVLLAPAFKVRVDTEALVPTWRFQ